MINAQVQTLPHLLSVALGCVKWDLEVDTNGLCAGTQAARREVARKEALVARLRAAIRETEDGNAFEITTVTFDRLLAESLGSVRFTLETTTFSDDLLGAIGVSLSRAGEKENERRIAEYEAVIHQIEGVVGRRGSHLHG